MDEFSIIALIATFPSRQDSLLPILHAIQERCGWIAPQAIPVIARELNLTRAEVHGVVSFYHHFRIVPPGRLCCTNRA